MFGKEEVRTLVFQPQCQLGQAKKLPWLQLTMLCNVEPTRSWAEEGGQRKVGRGRWAEEGGQRKVVRGGVLGRIGLGYVGVGNNRHGP